MLKKILFWLPRIVAALILLQTLYFKFTAAAESVYIFSTLGMEPWGRIGTGVVELFAGVFLLVPRLSLYGAILTVGVMCGAIASHLTKLGIVVQDDGGYLFFLALVTTACAAIVLYQERSGLFRLLKKFN